MKGSVDRGWAWIVLAACFLRAFMVIGIDKTFGMFFVEYIEAFESNASTVSVVISTQQIVYSLSSFLILTFGNRFFTFRPIIILGSVLMAAGYFLNAFAPNVQFLLLSQGVLFGIGHAASAGPSLVVLNSYFDKRRGLANSLANSGGSLGGLLLPLIIQALLETYGLQGAQIVVSGMLLNIVVFAALLRPLTNTVPQDRLNLEVKVEEDDESKNGNHIEINLNQEDMYFSADDVRSKLNKSEKENKENEKLLIELPPPNTHYRKRTFSENLHEYRVSTVPPETGSPKSADASKFANLSAIYGSLADVSSSVQSVFLAKNVEIPKREKEDDETETCFSKYILSVINFKILRNHHLKLLYLLGFLAIFSARLQLAYIPPYARDCGISGREISYLVTIIGTCDFFGRFGVALILDSKRVKLSSIISASLIIMGVTCMCNSFIHDFHTFIAYCVVYGLFGGLYNSVVALLLVDAVGPKNLSTALAFVLQVHGVSTSAMAPILGYIRDSTGSYTGSFYIMGVGNLLSALLLLFGLPIAKKMELRRQQRCLSETIKTDQSAIA
ncbi:MFS transporter, MCP family, solute carrier family 16 (monocarboxylic acid transporters), member 4 [Mytilus galloprovincialis]|uniref:MFS transporter, MCP family, solute carrier family 16 (Monocarboxylic acid transporters), member 4 n=1 Tax=Mytilus galloprovincialis TaxID=29158 RepID=A0A8B6EW67_MYTGA|nr:MFS transporter, MCP family, solute carrier family 16 (monocarboxylic acid transporters), member 4 [Mytilus galloprovincialis]